MGKTPKTFLLSKTNVTPQFEHAKILSLILVFLLTQDQGANRMDFIVSSARILVSWKTPFLKFKNMTLIS